MTAFSNGKYANVKDAGFVLVKGDEASEFLQTILTTNIITIPFGGCRPSALLTPQGRILVDLMVYRLSNDEVYLQTDIERCENLLTKLRRYRLRRKIEIDLGTNVHLTLWWEYSGKAKPKNNKIFLDPRHPDLGCRIISIGKDRPSEILEARSTAVEQWHYQRIKQAIPEGPIDLTPERALMLEAGLDKLAAVDFEKGCYIGQEVTARTHYRGLIKRRLLPLHCSGSPPSPGSKIRWMGKTIANSKTSAPCYDHSSGSIFLALLKLEDIHSMLEAASTNSHEIISVNESTAQLSPPAWCLPIPLPTRR